MMAQFPDLGTREDYRPMSDEKWLRVIEERATHDPECTERYGAGGDCTCGPDVKARLSMLRCSECGELLDSYGCCVLHGLLDTEAMDGYAD